jgi:hypothetical protein
VLSAVGDLVAAGKRARADFGPDEWADTRKVSLQAMCRGRGLHSRDMVVFFERLRNRRKVQTLETGELDNIVLQAPVLGFERNYQVYVLEQAGDRVRLRVCRRRDAPQNVCIGQSIPLDRQSEAHLHKALRRCGGAWARQLLARHLELEVLAVLGG